MNSNPHANARTEVAALGPTEWSKLFSCGELEAIAAGFRRFYVADRERAERLLIQLQLDHQDEVINHFASAPDEDELSHAEEDEELRAALEVLHDDEWISADEAKRRLLGE